MEKQDRERITKSAVFEQLDKSGVIQAERDKGAEWAKETTIAEGRALAEATRQKAAHDAGAKWAKETIRPL